MHLHSYCHDSMLTELTCKWDSYTKMLSTVDYTWYSHNHDQHWPWYLFRNSCILHRAVYSLRGEEYCGYISLDKQPAKTPAYDRLHDKNVVPRYSGHWLNDYKVVWQTSAEFINIIIDFFKKFFPAILNKYLFCYLLSFPSRWLSPCC